MTLFTIIIVLVVAGIALWLINSYIPMAESIKKLLNVVVIIVLIVWILNAFGVLNILKSVHL